MRRIPLNAVRAFEAAARRKGVVGAAHELCVSPTAISHQLRTLENFLGVQLFDRSRGRLDLMPDARASMGKLTRALDLIDEALSSIGKEAKPRLLIGASASVASLWLLPRLMHFVERHPDLDVSVKTFVNPSEIESDEDAVWICSWETTANRRIEPFMEEEMIPVCSPQLAAQYDHCNGEILRRVPLLHQGGRKPDYPSPHKDWAPYLRIYGVMRDDLSKGAHFNQASSAIEAAVAGMGAILGRSTLIGRYLESGQLVRIGESLPTRRTYCVVSPWKPVDPVPVLQFRRWVFEQAGRLLPQ